MQLATRPTSSTRARLILATLLGALALLLLFASPAAAHYARISGTVTGQLPGGKAEPLAEVRVTVMYASTEEVVSRTVTNSNGEYEAGATQGTWDVRFEPPTEAFQATTVRNVEVESTRQLNLVLSPAKAVEITGTLLSAEGKPAVGANVSMSNEGGGANATTDAEGRFHLELVPGEYSLTSSSSIEAQDGLPARWWFWSANQIAVESSREIELRLPPTHRLTYEVLGSGGAPLAGVGIGTVPFRTGTVAFGGGLEGTFESPYYDSVRTGEDGRATYLTFGGKPQSATTWVAPGEGSGYGTSNVAVPTVQGDTTLTVHPPKAVEITGTLLSAEGKPAVGANVSMSNEGGGANATTDAEGHFDLELVPGEYFLTASSSIEGEGSGMPRRWWFWSQNEIAVEAGRSIELRLPPTRRLTYEVLGQGGAPLTGAEVGGTPFRTGSVELGDGVEGNFESGTYDPATTGEDGRASFISFGGKPQSASTWVAPGEGSGYGTSNVEVPTVEGDTTLTVHPPKAVEITGTLLSAEGKPAVGANVSMNDEGGGAGTTTDAEGRFHLELVPGEYSLTSSSSTEAQDGLPPRWWFWSANEIAVESSREIELRLPPTRRLTYEVLGSGGAPLAGVGIGTVPFRTGTVAFGGGLEGTFESPYYDSVRTGEDGRATYLTFGGKPQSATTWVAPGEGSGYGTSNVAVPTVEGDTTLTVNLGTEAGEDTTPPSLNELGFEPNEIDVSSSAQRVSIGAEITDDLSGFAKGTISFRSPSGEVFDTAAFERVGGTATAGDYRAKVPFERFSEAGEWKATVVLVDEAGNRREYSSGQLQELGFFHVERVIDEKAAEEDTTPPNVDEFGIEPGEVDVSSSGRIVTAYAHITDELSGVAKATVSLHSPSGEVRNEVPLERISGNAHSGDYRAEVGIEQFSEAGDWTATVVLTDNAGNRRELPPVELEELGFQAGVRVTSGPPVVSEIAPGSGPETGGTEVRISGSGLGAVDAVHFGAAAATKFSVQSPSSIVAVAPPGTGTVDVTVTTPAGTSATSSADRFSYSPPVTITSSQDPSTHGQKVTLTARVTPAREGGPAPQGTVTFEEGSSTLGVANLTSKGTATLNTTALGAGAHKIIAYYSGDSNYGPGSSEPLLQVVEKATTQVSLAATLNPTAYGSSASLKATVKAVAPGAGTPAGTVTFREGETVLATVQLAGSVASLPLKSLSPGTHEISASYSGDHDDFASEAGAYAETVTEASTQLNLYSTLNPAPFGSSGTIKATVSPVAPGGGTPSGTVTFSEGETVLASVPLSGTTASYSLKSLQPGVHAIRATYSGAPGYLGSEASLEEEVTAARTNLSLTSTLAPFGSAGTLKATVTAQAPGGGTPAGTVTFREGETVLASVPLTGSVAKLALKEMAPGEHPITATYNGSADYEASEDSLTQTITKATTKLTVTSTKNPAPFGSTGTIKATVATVAPGGGTATGTVTFREGETTLATVPLSGTSATYPLKSLAAGTHEITATYNGSADYEPSSGSISQAITP